MDEKTLKTRIEELEIAIIENNKRINDPSFRQRYQTRDEHFKSLLNVNKLMLRKITRMSGIYE